MKVATPLLVALVLAGCASARPQSQAVDPELFSHAYEFSGMVGGRDVSGRFWFRRMGDPVPIELNMNSPVAGTCRTEMRVLNMSHMVLRCGGIQLDFVRGGRLVERPNMAWTRVEQQQRRGCVRWTRAANGQQVCAMEGTETVDVPITVRGVVTLTRVDS